ncbi:hypothetical protein [Pararhodobacter sp.]|uniref:hypothetical protein n=1 Tax=Pararhodobacter sp. TaxID=2127056 RepID=UPI002B001DE5|nr:hypothetical protein [Pararhodobacter sp.]
MTRTALAFAALLTLSLNGSIAVAAVPACTGGSTCALPLGMLTPPPPRPATLLRDAAVLAPAEG